MPRKMIISSETVHKPVPAMSPEDRENQMINLAVSFAEQQMLAGTASSQIVTHYLKLGTVKNQLELEKIRYETELLKAKKEALASEGEIKELYANAIAAFTDYRGGNDGNDQNIF